MERIYSRTSVQKLEKLSFRKEISGILQKKIDFFKSRIYTVSKWSEMDEKWSKMEEVSPGDR